MMILFKAWSLSVSSPRSHSFTGVSVSSVHKPFAYFLLDTPLALFNSYGAWTDERIVDDYFNYAKFVISRYDEWVPIWYTFNERRFLFPNLYVFPGSHYEAQYCNWQYKYYPAGNAKGYYPAYHGITGGLRARIACSHYTILAHAKVAKW